MEINTNKIELIGEVITDIESSNEIFGEEFYTFTLKVRRLSEVSDYIEILIPKYLIDIRSNLIGKNVNIIGEIRSYWMTEKNRKRTFLMVLAKEIYLCKKWETVDTNIIEMEGYLGKKPVYRKTSYSKREIADLMLAVNRRDNKSSYIPTITWGRNARFISEFNVGTKVKILGRLQSRDYNKNFADGTSEVIRAYEVSASIIEVVEG